MATCSPITGKSYHAVLGGAHRVVSARARHNGLLSLDKNRLLCVSTPLFHGIFNIPRFRMSFNTSSLGTCSLLFFYLILFYVVSQAGKQPH